MDLIPLKVDEEYSYGNLNVEAPPYLKTQFEICNADLFGFWIIWYLGVLILKLFMARAHLNSAE